MERRLKERLVGAVILVAVVVLVVPEFLQGPKSDVRAPVADASPDSHTYTVDLSVPSATPSAVEAASAPAALEPSASAPIASLEGAGEPAVPVPTAAPVRAEAPARSAPATAAPLPAEPVGVWAVQLGSFASQANADKLARQVKALGFAPYVSGAGSGAQQRFRVRLGPMADRAAAEHTIEKLKAQGQAASLVPPKP